MDNGRATPYDMLKENEALAWERQQANLKRFYEQAQRESSIIFEPITPQNRQQRRAAERQTRRAKG